MSSTTSNLYKEIYERGNWVAESKLDVYPSDSDTLFYSFGEERLVEMRTTRALMPDGALSVGNVIVGQIEVSFYSTDNNESFLNVPKNATLKPYFRLVDKETNETSEWVQKGVFNVDTRKYDSSGEIVKIIGYDPTRKLEVGMRWEETTATNSSLLNYLAQIMGVDVDSKTFGSISPNDSMDLTPINSSTVGADQNTISARYVLECFCGSHFANAFITNEGKLLVLPLSDINSGVELFSLVGCLGVDGFENGDKQMIGAVVASFNAFGDSKTAVFGTSDWGITLNVDCPFKYLNENHFSDLLQDYSHWENYSYSSNSARIDPSADLGDWFYYPNSGPAFARRRRNIHRQTTNFGTLMKSSVESPGGEISEYETYYQNLENGGYFYQTQSDRDFAARPTWSDMMDAVGEDTVLEQGESDNGWSYRKWSGGKCELWITTKISPSSSTATGSGYYSDSISLPTLPFPVSDATLTGTSSGMSLVANPSFTSSGYTASIRLMRFAAVSTTSTYTVHIRIDGNWQ